MTVFPALLPSPQRILANGEKINLAGASVIAGDDVAKAVAQYAEERLQQICASTAPGEERARIVLSIVPETRGTSEEAYKLSVGNGTVQIEAQGAAGLFYGVQTLLQLAEPSAGAAVEGVVIEDWPLLAQRSVHVDLRSNCLMPTFDYLIETVKELARYKYNAIVLEWEDKFPYQRHPEIASSQALTQEQVKTLFEVAEQHHIQIIPLLQTLGHVEYILKHPQYADLREKAGDVAQFCPCQPGSLALLGELLDELLEAHPQAKYVHLGADEPWLLGSCPRCAARAAREGIASLYLEHVGAMCRRVVAAGKIPMIWGEVVTGVHEIAGQDANWLEQDSNALASVPSETRMVYWDYHGVKAEDFSDFEAYRKQGFQVWVAPTTRYSEITPYYEEHLANIGAFLEAGIEQQVEGTLITSWAWKNMPFEMTWHGLLCGAERAWAGGKCAMSEVEQRAVRLFYGAELPEVVQAMHLLSYPYWGEYQQDEARRDIQASYVSNNPGSLHRIMNAGKVREKALRARELLAAAREKVGRRAHTLRDWEVAATLVAHVTKKQMLFDQVDALAEHTERLLDREGLAQLRRKIEELAEERKAIEQLWRETLLRTNTSEEVERDNALRFAGERAHTEVILEQLHVFEVAEGRRIWR